MSIKQGLSGTNVPGVHDIGNRAYSDTNAPGSMEMTVATEPPSPPSGETVLWSPDGASLLMKSAGGVVTTVGPSAGGGGGGSAAELAATTDYATTMPSLPSTGIKIFARHRARRLPSFVGPMGQDTSLQPGLFSNRIGYASAAPNNATINNSGLTFAVGTTPTAVTPASSSFFAGLTRARFSTTATAATSNSARVNALANFTSTIANAGGFFVVMRWGISASTATSRIFMGMSATQTVLAPGTEPTALLNLFGFGANAADTNLSFITNDGSGTATKVDLGTNFPAKTANTNFYETRLFVPAGAGNNLHWAIQRLNDGVMVQSSTPVTTDMPAVGTLLTPHMHISNGTTAAIASFDFQSMYVETDN